MNTTMGTSGLLSSVASNHRICSASTCTYSSRLTISVLDSEFRAATASMRVHILRTSASGQTVKFGPQAIPSGANIYVLGFKLVDLRRNR